MNLNCPICAEIFVPSDDVFATTCGHLFHNSCLNQWLGRSKTCPQCRNKCTTKTITKLYFNLANLDSSRIDVGTLQEQVDNANLQVKIKEQEVNKSKNEVLELKTRQKKTIKIIEGLEEKVSRYASINAACGEQMKALRTETLAVDGLRKENNSLKEKLNLLETVKQIVGSTQKETEALLKEGKNPEALCICIATLKRELRQADTKKSELRTVMRDIQTSLRRSHEKNKVLTERVSQLESENYNLLKSSEKKKSEATEAKLDDTTTVLKDYVVLDSDGEPEAKRSKMTVLERLNNPSPGIRDKVKQIEESTSPYLNIKSSNLGLKPLLRFRPQADKKNADPNTIKLSILHKRPMLHDIASNPKRPNLVFNGFGGSSKPDENNFPRKKIIEDTTSPMKSSKPSTSLSNRLKAGKLRKFPSANDAKIDEMLKKL